MSSGTVQSKPTRVYTSMMPHLPLLCLSLIAVLVSVSSGAAASPLVPGFERFARHARQPDGGAILLTELSCTACHAASDKLLAARRGPDLSGAALRLDPVWMRDFIQHPQQAVPGTAMPAMLHALPVRERRAAAGALVAFLMTQRQPFPEVKSTASAPVAVRFWDKGQPERGKELFHTVGCVACHQPDPAYAITPAPPSSLESLLDELDEDELQALGLTDAARPVRSVPMAALSQKYSRRSLTHFLLNPELVRPSGRMPQLKLSPAEAADLAAWLLRDQSRSDTDAITATPEAGQLDQATDALVAEGKRLFVELRCSSCHTIRGMPQARPAPPLSELRTGTGRNCIDGSAPGLPSFSLDGEQQQALRELLSSEPAGQGNKSPADRVAFRMQQFNCYGCHVRDGQGGVGPKRRPYFEIEGHADLGDEGRLPPPLTGVGAKLTTDWLGKVLAGTGDVRPHMKARMPRFSGSSIQQLPADLALADGTPSQKDRATPAGSAALLNAGRQLLDTGCVQCHPLRGEQLPGVIGIDLANVPSRIHFSWFRQFLLNPAALKKRTRMPTFFPNGRSASPSVLDGQVDRQIAAMWTYLREIDRQPLPEKLEKGKVHNFELVPDERPLILRTFLEAAGPHGIAVGFPEKRHLSFDSEQLRVARFWKGRFLDAHSTWFNRFTPVTAPLGTDLVDLPAGVPFADVAPNRPWPAPSAENPEYRFLGYRLDASRTPEFLYRIPGFAVRDRIAPDRESGFTRRLVLTRDSEDEPPSGLWFRVLTGDSLDVLDVGRVRNETGLTVTIPAALAESGVISRIRSQAPSGPGDAANKRRQEWRIPVRLPDPDPAGSVTIELRYSW